MNEEKRINGGYEIIESCTIGSNELVIGHNGITFFPQKPPYLLTIPIYWEIKLYRLQRLL